MAVSKPLLRWSFKAGADLSAKQFTIVTLSTSSTISSAASGSIPIGILSDKPKENEYGTVIIGGVEKVKLGEEVKAGVLVAASNSGLGQKAASGQYVLGICLETGESGAFVPVLIYPGSGAKA